MSKLNWKDFKTDPPYDAKEDDEAGYETDYIYAYFTYRHTNRLDDMNSGPFISFRACKFSGGIFEGYESHMRTSPYPTDWIEVLSWINRDEVNRYLLEDYKYVI